MLIIPVLVATVDGLARARRRGHSILRWTVWVLAAAVPFALVVAVIVIARLAGLIVAPPGPLGAGAVTLHARPDRRARRNGAADRGRAGLGRRFAVIWAARPAPPTSSRATGRRPARRRR